MVPKVAGGGRSFVGAGLYYLHDKKASTRERVAFTHTENLPTRDPDKAIKCMAYTAMRQQQLKVRAGGSAKGRKLTQPVYCYSLSWAPGEDPSQEEMIGAAKESLKILGLADHETLFVGHNDEPHPHIHVIVNRVHPETGVAAPLKMDFLKLSTWAEAFEKRQGQIRCEQRVENNALRAQGEFVKDRDSQHSAEFHRWRQERVASQHDKRAMENAVLDARQERERDLLRTQRDRRIEELRLRVKEATRTDWRDLFTVQRQERSRLEAAQRNAWTRVRHFFRTHREEFRTANKTTRRQMIKSALKAFIGSRDQYTELERKQKADRIYFAGKLKARTAGVTKAINKEHERRLAELRERQAREGQAMRARHSEQSQQQAREIRSGKDKEIFRKERAGHLKQELEEMKKDINKNPPQAKTRGMSLRERINRAKLETPKDESKSTSGNEPRPQEPQPTAAKDKPADRMAAFKAEARDITEKRKPPKARGVLSEKFQRTRDERPAEDESREAFGKKPHPQEQRQPAAGRDKSADRTAAFKAEARDITEKRKSPKAQGVLSEKFQRARDENPAEKRTERKKTEFRENAKDAGRDRGRERTAKPKPPGGRKPT
jgi:hypothetical protein